MSLFAHINSAVNQFKAGATKFWGETVSPWLQHFLGSVLHSEVEALIPIATAAVASTAQELIDSKGDLGAFAEAAGKTLALAAESAKQSAIKVAGTSLLTAVTAAISVHATQTTESISIYASKTETPNADPLPVEQPSEVDSDSLGDDEGQTTEK